MECPLYVSLESILSIKFRVYTMPLKDSGRFISAMSSGFSLFSISQSHLGLEHLCLCDVDFMLCFVQAGSYLLTPCGLSATYPVSCNLFTHKIFFRKFKFSEKSSVFWLSCPNSRMVSRDYGLISRMMIWGG